jgi:hypothetical protein
LSAVVSELACDATGLTFFVGADHFLYGVSAHGGVSLRVPFGEPNAGPASSADGAVWAENKAGNLIRVRGQELRRLPPESSTEFDFGSPDALRDPDGNEWRVRGDGVLVFRSSAESEPILVELTSAPLFGPIWSRSARSVLLSARDGLVIAFGAVHAEQGH